MAVPLEKFVKQLEDSGILSGDTLKEFLPPKGQPKDAEELALELVRKKKLTRFQAEEVSKGKGKSLVFGNYVVMEKIGAGGMGQVFKARHQRMDRLVAVKLLPAAMTKDASAIARFEREVKAAAKLRHPNIIAADDADQANGVHFLVMEFVDGSDLSAAVKKNGPFSVDQAVNYILQAARGLEFAHKKGVVHRDIKPANLLLDSEGTVKILDMGLARIHGEAGQAELTSTGAVMGTVDYMAPEQALNTKTADARADIYSLGCSLFYLLTAKAAYDGDTLMAKLLAHRDQPIPSLRSIRAEVPGQLEAVFRKMVAKNITERFQTMSEVISALEVCNSPENTQHLQSSDTGPKNRLKDHPTASGTISIPATSKDIAVTSKAPPTRRLPDPVVEDVLPNFFDELPLAEKTFRTKKQTKPPGKKGKNAVLKNQKKLLMIGGALLGVFILLAGVMVMLRTRDGKLIVTVNEPDAVVEVLNEEGKIEITRKGETSPIKISVDPGKHRLTVQKDGFELFTESFEVKSGNIVSIKAELAPLEKAVVGKTLDTTERVTRVVETEWKLLFDGKSLAGWTGDVGLMTIENGILVNDGKRGIVTAPDDFGDVEIEIDFRLVNGGNSGLGICYSGSGDPAFEGLEIQMLDDDGYPNDPETSKCGSVWGLAAPKPGRFKRWPEWNQFRVTSTAKEVRVELNGVLVTSATRADMQKVNPKHVGAARTAGKLCLYPATGRSEYRNFRVRPIGPSGKFAPNDAVVFSGHSYKFFPDVVNWHQARVRCEEMGGHLPIIDSVEENTFVATLAEKEIAKRQDMDGVWLGATDEIKEGEWKWVNGSQLSFTKWGPGQPNNKQNEEHYLILFLQTREWSDQPVKSSQHTVYFVCEWDATPREGLTTNPADPRGEGWVSLFNGTSLDGWKAHPDDKAKWEVKDGILIGSGPDVGHIYSLRDDYENFHFKVEAKISDGGNSGQYFRAIFEKNYPHGYEAQINSTGGDPIRTGSLYNFVAIHEMLVKPDQWFTQEVIADGNHIVILVNGTKVVDFVDQANTYTQGHLALQHNIGSPGKDTVVQFRKIEVRELTKKRPGKISMSDSPAFPKWMKDVQAQPTEKQVGAVSKKMVELNPGFDGKLTGADGNGVPRVTNGVVTEIGILADHVTDISPVRVFVGLKVFRCFGSGPRKGSLSDLSPLTGMSLNSLNCWSTQVSDLSPLKGMPLDSLMCEYTRVSDLSPLNGMRLSLLLCDHTKVSDLSPLNGMPLETLFFDHTLVSNFMPLQGMKLKSLGFTPRNITSGIDVIRQMKTIELIGIDWQGKTTPDEFWKKYDAGEFGKPTDTLDDTVQRDAKVLQGE